MKDKFLIFIVPSFWFLLFCLFLFSFTSYAEDTYFPMNQNQNDKFTQDFKDHFDTTFDSDNNYIFVYFWGISNPNSPSGRAYDFYYCLTPKTSNTMFYGEINSNGYQFNIYKVGSGSVTVGYTKYYTRSGSWDNFSYGSNLNYLQNLNSSLYNSNIDYVSNFKLYTTNNQDVVVLKYGPDNPIVDIGTAILPGPFIEPTYTTGDNPPTNVPPSITINNYTWTTNNSPSFDNSSVENALDSLGDIISYQIGWLADNLHGEFTNLIGNIKNLIDYVGKTLQYYGNAIISSINNAIQNFYDNMSALVQPIFEKIAYITDEIDTDEISTAFTSTNFYGVKTQFTSAFTSFENAFDISEPNTFTLTINIQNIRTFYNFGCRSPVIIHLDDHFIPIRSALRTFLWVLISFGTVFVIDKGLANWLRGERNT